ncbi:MAG: VOC family protein [Dermatophilaceae bacterium]
MPTHDESWPCGTPCWVDVMVTDPAAAKAFYSSLFGWDIQDGPPEAGGYAMCLLNGRPAAAISPKPAGNPFPNCWSTYLASDDLEATAARARAAGGQFMMEPMDVMSAGRMAFGMDPTGGPYGIWQAGDHKGVGVFNEPGALIWNELMTGDYEGAKAFYGSVFGYEYEQMGDGTKFQYSTIRSSDGKVVGGIGAMGAEVPADMTPQWTTYFNVADTDATVAKAAVLGATIVRDPWVTPFGRMAMIQGPQGETFSIAEAPRRGDGAEQSPPD